MTLRKRPPTWSAQIDYHLSQDRGTWENPLATFRPTKDRRIEPAPPRSDAGPPLTVPIRLTTVEEATAERHRAAIEAIATRGLTRGLRELLVVFGAVAAAVMSAVFVDSVASSAELAALPRLLALVALMVVLVFGAAGAWHAFGATNQDLEVSQGVWDERVRLYDVRIAELRAGDRAGPPSCPSACAPRRGRWLPWR